MFALLVLMCACLGVWVCLFYAFDNLGWFDLKVLAFCVCGCMSVLLCFVCCLCWVCLFIALVSLSSFALNVLVFLCKLICWRCLFNVCAWGYGCVCCCVC